MPPSVLFCNKRIERVDFRHHLTPHLRRGKDIDRVVTSLRTKLTLICLVNSHTMLCAWWLAATYHSLDHLLRSCGLINHLLSSPRVHYFSHVTSVLTMRFACGCSSNFSVCGRNANAWPDLKESYFRAVLFHVVSFLARFLLGVGLPSFV